MYSKMKNFEHLKWHTLSVTKHNYLSSAKRCYKYPLQWQGPPRACLPAKQTYLSLGVFGESLAVWVWKPWTLRWFVEFYCVTTEKPNRCKRIEPKSIRKIIAVVWSAIWLIRRGKVKSQCWRFALLPSQKGTLQWTSVMWFWLLFAKLAVR